MSMNSKWSQDKKNRLKEIIDNASSKKEGFEQDGSS